jgi:hypothetical protein
MAKDYSNMSDFKLQTANLTGSRDLFAIILFDDRPSHKVIEKFVHEEFEWLDNLANFAGIYFFLFLRQKRLTIRQYLSGVHNDVIAIENPNLEISRLFGISPNVLPGIVIFTVSKVDLSFGNGIFFPLRVHLFDDIPNVERVFSDLFTIIQMCREESDTPDKLLKKVDKKIKGFRQREKTRPILKQIGNTLISISEFPKELIEAMASAFAEETARKMMS